MEIRGLPYFTVIPLPGFPKPALRPYGGKLGHQLAGNNAQHTLQFPLLIGRKAIFNALHHCVQVLIADIVIIAVFLRGFQAVLPLVLLTLHLFPNTPCGSDC